MSDTSYCCFVGGLAWATDENTLRETFGRYGEVLDAKIIFDRETGRSRGFGFVYFADRTAMDSAVAAMNGAQLDGRSITVSQAQSTATGGRSGRGGRAYGARGGGGGRGGGRSSSGYGGGSGGEYTGGGY